MVTEDIEDIQKQQQSLGQPIGDHSIGLVLFPNANGGTASASIFPSNRMKSKTYDHLFEAWLVGSIHYRDRFGNNYHTDFRLWMVDRQTMSKPFRFTPTPGYEVDLPFVPNGAGEVVL
jgi:hypothetical protein